MRQVEMELLCLQRLAMICEDDPEYMSADDRHALNLLIARKLWAVQDTWSEGATLPPLNVPVQVVRFEDFCTMYERVKCWKSKLHGIVEVPHQVLIRRDYSDSYAPDSLQMRVPALSKGDEELIVVLRTRDFMWRHAS
ncbi:hypothetical protein CPT_Slocum_045 [Serratia phage Slocum]|nr:hypothetical protein CPT_Slocum_045 [Serratia phage Slocum]